MKVGLACMDPGIGRPELSKTGTSITAVSSRLCSSAAPTCRGATDPSSSLRRSWGHQRRGVPASIGKVSSAAHAFRTLVTQTSQAWTPELAARMPHTITAGGCTETGDCLGLR